MIIVLPLSFCHPHILLFCNLIWAGNSHKAILPHAATTQVCGISLPPLGEAEMKNPHNILASFLPIFAIILRLVFKKMYYCTSKVGFNISYEGMATSSKGQHKKWASSTNDSLIFSAINTKSKSSVSRRKFLLNLFSLLPTSLYTSRS